MFIEYYLIPLFFFFFCSFKSKRIFMKALGIIPFASSFSKIRDCSKEKKAKKEPLRTEGRSETKEKFITEKRIYCVNIG